MQEKVFADKKIETIWGTEVVEMMGENILEAVKLKAKPDSKQVEKLKADNIRTERDGENNLVWTLPVNGVFVAIGHQPMTDIFQGKIDIDEKGYIKRIQARDGENFYHSLTNVKGIFVAGDVHDHIYEQAITAAGFGCMAGLDALKYLDKSV